MPFDVREFTGGSAGDRAASPHARKPVAIWLFSICAMILVMVVLGGVTRLTGSGLSIMEWAPVTGALPPFNHADWEQLFALYKSIPQYKIVNEGMSLAGFQQIFWMEWVHRLWGRLIGVAFLLPLLWFWATGRIERRLRPRLLVLFLLGGLQGAVGWFMVASGFRPDSTAVAPIRLAVHLALALILYVAILWTALGVLNPQRRGSAPTPLLRVGLGAFLALISLTIVAGSLTAGTHAGFEYNTFPLMEGRLIPENYARLQPFIRNLTQNLATVQFDHRLLASLTLLAGCVVGLAGWRELNARLRRAATLVGILTAVQYMLGVATLVLVVPIPLAALHQANAVLALTAGIWALHEARASRPVPVLKIAPAD